VCIIPDGKMMSVGGLRIGQKEDAVMVARLTQIGIMVALLLGFVGVNFAASENEVSPASDQDESAGSIVPKWRFYTQVFWSSDPSVGVYRRIGKRWDCGLQLSGSFWGQDGDEEWLDQRIDDEQTDRETGSEGESSSDNLYLVATTEVRRWKPQSERLLLFYGVRLDFSYTDSEENRFSRRVTEQGQSESIRDREYFSERESYRLSLAPILGVDLPLLDHLSVAIVLAPVSLSRSWHDNRSVSTERHEEGTSQVLYWSESKSDDAGNKLGWDLTPEIHLSVTF
jgi:hypothetical protein